MNADYKLHLATRLKSGIPVPVFCQRPFVRARQMPRLCFVLFLQKSRNDGFCERPRSPDLLFRSLLGRSSLNPRCPFYIRPEIKGFFYFSKTIFHVTNAIPFTRTVILGCKSLVTNSTSPSIFDRNNRNYA